MFLGWADCPPTHKGADQPRRASYASHPSRFRRRIAAVEGQRRACSLSASGSDRRVGFIAIAEASIHIDRPAEEVFAFVGDPANNPLWRKNVVRCTWLDDGPMRIGRRGRQTARVLGIAWTVETEVIEWDPPRRATWRTVQGPVSVRSWVRVEPDGSGCIAAGGADGRFTGPIGGLLTRLAVPRMVRQAELDPPGAEGARLEPSGAS